MMLPFDQMLEFQNGKIELYGCFRICRLKVIFQNFGDDFSTLLQGWFIFLRKYVYTLKTRKFNYQAGCSHEADPRS